MTFAPAPSNNVTSTALRIWARLLGIGLLVMGNGLQSSLLGLVAEDSGFSSVVTGIVITGYFAGFMFGSNYAEAFIRKVGHVRSFAALASLGSAAILVHGLLIEPVTWTAMRFVTGFSFAGLYVVTESWLNREATTENRGGLLAVYMIIVHAGLAAGQGLLNIASITELTLYVVASIVLSLAVIPILLSSAPQPDVKLDSERLGLRKLIKTTPLGTFGCFTAGIANGVLLGMGMVYARQIGLDVAGVSLFMAAIMVGGAAFQWPIGTLSDQMDRRWVIVGVCLFAALISALLPLFQSQTYGLIGLVFVLGGLVLTIYPLFLSYANDWFDPDQMVSASSGLVMVYGAGAMLGPLGTGFLLQALGPIGFPAYLVVVHLVIALYALWRTTMNDGPKVQDDFLLAPAPMGVSDVWAETAAESAEEA